MLFGADTSAVHGAIPIRVLLPITGFLCIGYGRVSDPSEVHPAFAGKILGGTTAGGEVLFGR